MDNTVKEIRTMLGLTQLELARRSRVRQSRLSLSEAGYVELKESEYKALKQALRTAILDSIARCNQALATLS